MSGRNSDFLRTFSTADAEAASRVYRHGMFDEPRDAATRFLLELARALHVHGTPAHDLERLLSTVARRLGLKAEFFSTPTSLMVGLGDMPTQQVRLMRVDPGTPNLGHLSALDAVTRDVVEGRISAHEGLARVRQLLASPQRWPVWLQVLAFVLASAAVASFLRLRVGDLFVASVLGLVTSSIAMMTARVTRLAHVTEALAAFVVTTIAIVFDTLNGRDSGYLTALAGLVVLLPGLTFTVALTELSTRHLASGTARMSGALVVFLGLGFGLALGAGTGKIIGSMLIDTLGPVTGPWSSGAALPNGIEWLGVVVAALAFAVLLNAEARHAGRIVLACLVAYVTHRFTGAAMGDELAAFVSAAVVTAMSNVLAISRQTSSMVTAVPGLLILVPGSIGFRSVSSFIGAEVEAGISTAFHVAIIGISIAAGIVAGNVLSGEGDTVHKESAA